MRRAHVTRFPFIPSPERKASRTLALRFSLFFVFFLYFLPGIYTFTLLPLQATFERIMDEDFAGLIVSLCFMQWMDE